MIAVQRLFLLDSLALETSYKIIERAQPDYLELLPGIMPDIIQEVREHTGVPVIAGGLIRKKEDVAASLDAGAFPFIHYKEFLSVCVAKSLCLVDYPCCVKRI